MKKFFFVATIFGVITFNAFGQTQFDAEDLRFGFQLSPTFSFMNTSSSRINSTGTNLGIKLGMVGEYYFTGDNRYAFTTGLGFSFNSGGTLLYENRGVYWTRSDLDPSLPDTLPAQSRLKFGIQYLEIPAGLKMRFQPASARDIGYFIEPAVIIGIKTQARGEISGPGIGEVDDKINIRQEVNNLNLSWGITAGIEYELSETNSLIGGVGFQTGFTDVTDDNGTVFRPGDPDGNREDSKGTITNIIVRIGILF